MTRQAVSARVSALHAATVLSPIAAAALVTTSWRRRERRDRVVALVQPFLDEPMATTRRSAWAFLHQEGDDVRPASHYWGEDEAYLDVGSRNGFADLLRVMLFFRLVEDLRAAGELDRGLHRRLLEPHRRAWTGYTARMAAHHADDPADGLFRWRAVG